MSAGGEGGGITARRVTRPFAHARGVEMRLWEL